MQPLMAKFYRLLEFFKLTIWAVSWILFGLFLVVIAVFKILGITDPDMTIPLGNAIQILSVLLVMGHSSVFLINLLQGFIIKGSKKQKTKSLNDKDRDSRFDIIDSLIKYLQAFISEDNTAKSSQEYSGEIYDLRLDLKLGFYEAIWGGPKEIRIAHLIYNPKGQAVTDKKRLKIEIPPGAYSGTRLRIVGFGDERPNGEQAGDLYVFLDVATESGALRREGPDIVSELKITARQANAGMRMAVDTIDGKAKISIPPNVKRGHCLKIPGRGAPILNAPDTRGDHIVKIYF